ncbi:hypothetical protein L1D52_24150 [Vibrio brasiliensis]|uniref:hypothetical protein n=1 Tax=Vibrio brasiliensis TaxID=170652 RepID=UPI001EFD1108|nr:hypothetical protein [Vibrio brasiliensis]MCG9785405.1 hypothetical protein [Vibrio brasiliensis]
MNGSLSPDILKQQCHVVGKNVFGSKALGRLLWSLVLRESQAGQSRSEHGGVCSISYTHWTQMQRHHQFKRFSKQILKATGLQLDRIQFQHLAISPELSLIVSGAWFMANTQIVPNCPDKQAKLISRYWEHYSPSVHAA